MVLCGTWSETSVAQSQLTQFLANSKTQNTFLFTVNAIFRHDYPVAVERGSTPRPLVQKKKLGEILYLLICSFLSCLSSLLHSRVRKSRRDLWITLYYSVRQTFTCVVASVLWCTKQVGCYYLYAYSEWVSLISVIQLSKRMHRVILSSVACLTSLFFHITSSTTRF